MTELKETLLGTELRSAFDEFKEHFDNASEIINQIAEAELTDNQTITPLYSALSKEYGLCSVACAKLSYAHYLVGAIKKHLGLSGGVNHEN